MAVNGKLVRGLTGNRLRRMLMAFYVPKNCRWCRSMIPALSDLRQTRLSREQVRTFSYVLRTIAFAAASPGTDKQRISSGTLATRSLIALVMSVALWFWLRIRRIRWSGASASHCKCTSSRRKALPCKTQTRLWRHRPWPAEHDKQRPTNRARGGPEQSGANGRRSDK